MRRSLGRHRSELVDWVAESAVRRLSRVVTQRERLPRVDSGVQGDGFGGEERTVGSVDQQRVVAGRRPANSERAVAAGRR